jgi:GTPase SAR1 family protein
MDIKNTHIDEIYIREIISEIQYWQQIGQDSYTVYYRKSGKIIGIYSGNEPEESGILFVNKDYSDPALVLELIHQHCHVLNEEIMIYTWDAKAIETYESVTPRFYRLVDL